ncbi:MAG: hypothetical protein E7Z91_03345 [Cyanobacteria bacterium SIG30]|nr:hypothetical protein [Cyanobacteria bacterium SIG30]
MIIVKENANRSINLTGYRILFILQLLTQGPISKKEITESIKNNPYLKNISTDTIRLDINTLKSVGFEIEHTDDNNEKKYILLTNPLQISLTDSEIKTLNQIKTAAIELWDWKNIIKLYKTFEKVTKFIKDKNQVEEIMNFGYFMQIDFKLLEELNKYCRLKNVITLLYNSPKNGIMPIKIKTHNIVHDKNTNKLYLIGQFENYNYLSYLRIEKIIKVERIELKGTIKEIEPVYKIYQIKKDENFVLEDNEKIIKEENDYLEIQAKIINDFHYIQRIVTLGDKIIKVDNETKKKIYENLIKTRNIYN